MSIFRRWMKMGWVFILPLPSHVPSLLIISFFCPSPCLFIQGLVAELWHVEGQQFASEVKNSSFKTSIEIPQNLKHQSLHVIPQSHFWIHVKGKWNQYVKEIFRLSCWLQYQSQYLTCGINLCAHHWMTGQKKWSTEYYSVLKEKGILSFVTWMNSEHIIAIEINQIEKLLKAFAHMWVL
jgi:hypothetical protein